MWMRQKFGEKFGEKFGDNRNKFGNSAPKFLDNPSDKDEHGNIHTTEIRRKTYKNSIYV